MFARDGDEILKFKKRREMQAKRRGDEDCSKGIGKKRRGGNGVTGRM